MSECASERILNINNVNIYIWRRWWQKLGSVPPLFCQQVVARVLSRAIHKPHLRAHSVNGFWFLPSLVTVHPDRDCSSHSCFKTTLITCYIKAYSQRVYQHETGEIVAFSIAGDAGQFGISSVTCTAGGRVIFGLRIVTIFVAEVDLPATVACPVDRHHHCSAERSHHVLIRRIN